MALSSWYAARTVSHGGAVFGRVLRAGERIALEYHTHYSRPPHPVTEMRRPARARAENIDIALEFTPERRPAQVWWTI
ncbi:hypothetical protein ACLQ2P_26380 [Actinomadura citrea]